MCQKLFNLVWTFNRNKHRTALVQFARIFSIRNTFCRRRLLFVRVKVEWNGYKIALYCYVSEWQNGRLTLANCDLLSSETWSMLAGEKLKYALLSWKKQSEIYDDNMPHSHLERQSTVTTNHFFTKELHSVLQYIWNTCTFNTWVTFSSFILLFSVFQHIIILLEQKQMRICERFIKHRWSGCVVCIKRISLGKHYNKTDNYTVKSLCQQYLKLSNITYLLLIMTYS